MDIATCPAHKFKKKERKFNAELFYKILYKTKVKFVLVYKV